MARPKRVRVLSNEGRMLTGLQLDELFAYPDVSGWTVERGDPSLPSEHRYVVTQVPRQEALDCLRSGGG